MESAKTDGPTRYQARVLRENMSGFEKKLWKLVGGEGNPWGLLRQIPMQGYFLDFYSPEGLACVEADGPDHINTADRDMQRDAVLRKAGIRTLRIRPSDFSRMRPLAILDMIGSFIQTED